MSASHAAIPLVVGHPDEGPATFTRFMLPFAYRPEEIVPPMGPITTPCWREISRYRDHESDLPDAKSRFHYFTIETADVLYRRASWWRLETSEPLTFDSPRRRGGSFQVEILPPTLVLFEWPAGWSRENPFEARDDLMSTGFLLVDICFPDPQRAPDFDDLLLLNELFRYWQPPYPTHSSNDKKLGGHWYRHSLDRLPIDPVRGGDDTLGKAATANDQPGAEQRDLYTQRWRAWLSCPLLPASGAFRIFPESFDDDAQWRLHQPWHARAEGWAIYADQRTFVWTCAQVPGGASMLAEVAGDKSADLTTLGRWIKLLNVDQPGDAPAGSTAFERDWVGDKTYKRWLHRGTLYGFTYHSGAMVSSPEPEPPLWRHFRTTYSDQILLLLYLRVTTFRFSRALARQAAEARNRGHAESSTKALAEWQKRFARLQEDFVLFTDLYQFPLVSNQQQAVEMYATARKALDVDELFEEIKAEVSATDGLFDNLVARRLNRVAHVGLALALITGLFGMNMVIERLPGAKEKLLWIDLLWFVGISVFALWLFDKLTNGPSIADRWRRWRRRRP